MCHLHLIPDFSQRRNKVDVPTKSGHARFSIACVPEMCVPRDIWNVGIPLVKFGLVLVIPEILTEEI